MPDKAGVHMTDQEILERFVTDNKDLGELESQLQEFNMFEALDLVQSEIRHSNFIAWIMDPKETHGMGDYFLKRFLFMVAKTGRQAQVQTLSAIDVDAWELSRTGVLREWHNLDITITNDDDDKQFVVVIENKVQSAESPGQLHRYREFVESQMAKYQQVFVYLTPDGRRPENDDEAEHWINVSYSDLCETFEQAQLARSSLMGDSVKEFIRQYLVMLRRHVVSGSDVEQLARRIYDTHKKAIDLIIEHRADKHRPVYEIIDNYVVNHSELVKDDSPKSYYRFVPKEWLKLPFMSHGQEWTSSGRMLLFEIPNHSGRIVLNLIIGPGDQGVRDQLVDLVKSRLDVFPRAKRKPGAKWFTIYQLPLLTPDQVERSDLAELEATIGQKFDDLLSSQEPKMLQVLSSSS
jgi:hypothetical protein